MPENAPGGFAPSYCVQVFSAADLEVTSGANFGDPLIMPDELCLGDVYGLQHDARMLDLTIRDSAAKTGENRLLFAGDTRQFVAEGSQIGAAGEPLMLKGRLTFMAPDGDRVEILLIGHLPKDATEAALCFVPLAPIEPKVAYTLLTVSEDPGEVRLSDITPVAFTRGTLITLADGAQRAIEDLRVGDKILTRDHGPQPVRWIGQRTVRAIGPYAPVVISRGTLANESDLIVSQHQRLFIYQRSASRLTGTAEVFVRARDLVDDEAVFIRRGGFVDYFHLVFDHHEIIYAEYIPTESLLVNESNLGRLPKDLAHDMAARLPDLTQTQHYGTEADKALLRKLGKDALRPPRRGD